MRDWLSERVVPRWAVLLFFAYLLFRLPSVIAWWEKALS